HAAGGDRTPTPTVSPDRSHGVAPTLRPGPVASPRTPRRPRASARLAGAYEPTLLCARRFVLGRSFTTGVRVRNGSRGPAKVGRGSLDEAEAALEEARWVLEASCARSPDREHVLGARRGGATALTPVRVPLSALYVSAKWRGLELSA